MLKKSLKITELSLSLLVSCTFAQANVADEYTDNFDSLRILEGRTIIPSLEDGAWTITTTIFVNLDLNLETITQHIGSETFPIIIHRPKDTDIFGYRLESIDTAGIDSTEELKRYKYVIIGSICEDKNCSKTRLLNSGDSLSFNVKTENMELFNDNGFGFSNDSQYVKSKSDISATKLAWAKNATVIPPFVDPPISYPPPTFVFGNIRIQIIEHNLIFDNLPSNAKVEVYNLRGQKQGITNMKSGLYIVKINSHTFKIPVYYREYYRPL